MKIAARGPVLGYPARVKLPGLRTFSVLSLAAALVAGCGSNNQGSPRADADPDPGKDATFDRNDVPTLAADSSPDIAADHQATTEDSTPGGPDIRIAADAGIDAAAADGSADTAAGGLTDSNPGADLTALDSGGCTGWTSLLRLSPAELADLMTKIDPIVIDVHTPYYGDIPGTDTSIPYTNVDAIETYVHKDHCADIVLICEGGVMSQSAGNELVKRGYLRVRDLAGGMLAWEKAGYPLLKDGGI
jgi:rhodanese-related sulfurtransferase